MAEVNRWVGRDEHLGLTSLDRPDAPRAETWSLEAIAALERPHDAALSPDGASVATIVHGATSDVWVVPVSGGRPVRVTAGRELVAYWDDDAPAWSPDGSRIAYTTDGQVWVTPVAGGLPAEVGEGSSPLWLADDAIAYVVDRGGESRLVRANVEDPWPAPLTPPGQNVSGAWLSSDRAILLYIDHPADDRLASHIWLARLDTGDSLRLTGEPEVKDRFPRLSPDGTNVAFTSERAGWYDVYTIGTDGGGLRRVTGGGADFSGLVWHPGGGSLLATRSSRGVDDLVRVDASSGEASVIASGGEWVPVGWCDEGAVAVHEAFDVPPRLVVISDDGQLRVLYDSVPAQVRSAVHRRFEEVTYRSSDGTEIHGFLFRPPGSDVAPVPAVVYAHGGPTSVYGDQWDGHAQYFVEKGYAWLGVNFRGSTGYGRDFERANMGVWGVKDTEDCLAAADYLSSLDWVDGSRVGIYGPSYGSYLALAALAYDPEHRFACGVAKFGDSDIKTSWALSNRGGREELEAMMGTPAESREAYRAGSPLRSVADIERPILVVHGERDTLVHPRQSEQLVEELRRLGKQYEYITYPTEGHGLLNYEVQVHFYKRLERFLDWHLM